MVQYIHFNNEASRPAVVALKEGRQIGVVSQDKIGETKIVVLHYPKNESDHLEDYRCFTPVGSFCAYDILGELNGDETGKSIYDVLEQHLRKALEQERLPV